MIPIRDEIKTHRTPFVNYGLILINVVVFLLTYVLNTNPEGVYLKFAFFQTISGRGSIWVMCAAF